MGVETVRLNQALHGYADGHCQLASSLILEPEDAKTVLVLSDVSGSGAQIPPEGYLTGYPLTDSGVYALARTWAAPEMSRPGCVWTQTIFLDFTDLATIESMLDIAKLFRRPEGANIGAYRSELAFDEALTLPALDSAELSWARLIVTALYEEARKRIIAFRPVGLDVDQIVLSIWGQQWPRLRRGLRFCTLATSDRSSQTQPFDLQLLPSTARNVRHRFSEAVEADAISAGAEPWLEDAVHDLEDPNIWGLRTFLRQVAGGVNAGRDAFIPFCKLHQVIKSVGEGPSAIGAAIQAIEGRLGVTQARAVYATLANVALQNLAQLDNDAFEFVIDHLDLLDSALLIDNAATLGRAIWGRDPARLETLVGTGPAGRVILERTIGALDAAEIIHGLERFPSLLENVIQIHPALLEEPQFWASRVSRSADVLATSIETQLAVLRAIIAADRPDLAARAVSEAGAEKVLQALCEHLRSDRISRSSLDTWTRTLRSEQAAIASFLAGPSIKPVELLESFARCLTPDSIPNEFGADPWLMAVEALNVGSLENADRLLGAFLLC